MMLSVPSAFSPQRARTRSPKAALSTNSLRSPTRKLRRTRQRKPASSTWTPALTSSTKSKKAISSKDPKLSSKRRRPPFLPTRNSADDSRAAIPFLGPAQLTRLTPGHFSRVYTDEFRKPERIRMSTSKPVMEIPAKLVKELRERTNAGFSDCRAALVEPAAQLGDTANTAQLLEKAIEILRKKGQAAAAKKATREASEGLIGHYIHAGGKIGVIVEINCESDFVARTEAFQNLCHDVAMHIPAVDPRYVRRADLNPEMLEKEREIYMAQARATGKPEQVIQKIVQGKMEKFYEETCLYEQHYIKDETMTIGEKINQAISNLGENITIRRFSRFKVGEVPGGSAPSAPEKE